MGLASLILSIFALISFIVLFSGGLGILVSGVLSIVSLLCGIIGAIKKQGTATAGIVISLLCIAGDIFLLVILRVIKF